MIKAVKPHGWILGRFFADAHQSVERFTQLLPRLRAAFAETGRQHNIANLEILVVRVATNDKRSMLCTEKIWPSGAGHFRNRHVRRQSTLDATLPGNHRAE